MEFLGHIVGRDGLKPDPGKVEKIEKLREPTDVSSLRSVLGLFSYYRKFIKDFSKIIRPITKLLKKDIPLIWTDEQQRAFDILKEKLTTAPILQYPDFEKSFILMTDASKNGLGAVLSQLDDENREKVITYASRSLRGAEENYPITELEGLAVYWAVQYFHKYLLTKPFKIITDYSALKALQKTKEPKGRRARFIMELQQYRFEIVHRSGKSNANADALSRITI